MADVKLAYGTSTNMVITLASLTATVTMARECTAIDNSSNKYIDAMVYCQFACGAALASDKSIYVYFYGSEDGTNYTDNATGTDSLLTLNVPTNLRGPFVVSCPTSSTTYKVVIGSVASFFGGNMPLKWGVAVVNATNVILSSITASCTLHYTGIYETVV